MIARMALFAIWRPKLEETFLTPNASRLDRLRQVRLELRRLVGRQRLGADLEALVAVAVRRGPPALDDGARLADAAPLCSRTCSSEVGAGVLKAIWVPPLKSIPRLRPRIAEREDRDGDHGGRDAEPEPPAADEVDLQPAGMPPPAVPITRGLSRNFDPASSERKARVASTAVSIEIAVPISSISANPRTDDGRDREEHERRDRGDDVGVDDRREALRVSRLDRRARRCALRAPPP